MFVFRPTYPVWSAAPNNVAKVVHGAEVDGRAVVSLVYRLKDEIEMKYIMTLKEFWDIHHLPFRDPLQNVVWEHLKVHQKFTYGTGSLKFSSFVQVILDFLVGVLKIHIFSR